MEVSANAVREIAESPTLQGVELVRTQLEQVERHIAETMAHLDEHDRTLSEGVLRQVREHGELIARETTRVVESMQGYVQSGAEAMGRLAQRVEAHAEAFASGEASGALEPVRQQIEMLDERMGIHGRSMHELQGAVERLVEARIIGLAQLIRADSEALRGLIERRSDDHESVSQARLDERIEEVRATIESRFEAFTSDTLEQLAGFTAAVTASVDAGFERLGERVERFDGLDSAIVETQAVAEERLMSLVDERVTAIARLIRSDNRVLAERLQAGPGRDGEVMKQVLRSVKELQAGVATDMLGSMDHRFQAMGERLHQESQSTSEAIAKVAEGLGERIDRLAVKVDEGVDGDLQIVIDRMSDAIQAMSARGARQPRIDLERDLPLRSSCEEDSRRASLDGPFGSPFPFHAHPRLERCEPSLDGDHASTRHDLLTDEHGGPEVRGERDHRRGIPRPSDKAGSEVAHREHPVGDDAREPGRPSHVVIQVQGIQVPTRVGVGRDILTGNEPMERWKLVTGRDRRSRSDAPFDHRASSGTGDAPVRTHQVGDDREESGVALGADRVQPRADSQCLAFDERPMVRVFLRAVDHPAVVERELGIAHDIGEDHELGRGGERRWNALPRTEDGAEGRHPIGIHQEGRLRIALALKAGVHRSRTLPVGPARANPAEYGPSLGRNPPFEVRDSALPGTYHPFPMDRNPPGAIRVVIADDHRSFGEALQIALDRERDLTVIELVTDGAEAVRTTTREHPDVVLMDLQMPGVDGIEATRRIREEGGDSAIIILTGNQDEAGLARAVQAGARGYLLKTEPVEDLAKAIRRAHRGEPLHDVTDVESSLRRLRTRRAADGDLERRLARLTPREIEILQRMADGLGPEQIAEQLGMSRHTLRTHTQNILTKLGVHSKIEAVVAAIRFAKVRTDELAVEPEPSQEPTSKTE